MQKLIPESSGMRAKTEDRDGKKNRIEHVNEQTFIGTKWISSCRTQSSPAEILGMLHKTNRQEAW